MAAGGAGAVLPALDGGRQPAPPAGVPLVPLLDPPQQPHEDGRGGVLSTQSVGRPSQPDLVPDRALLGSTIQTASRSKLGTGRRRVPIWHPVWQWLHHRVGAIHKRGRQSLLTMLAQVCCPKEGGWDSGAGAINTKDWHGISQRRVLMRTDFAVCARDLLFGSQTAAVLSV